MKPELSFLIELLLEPKVPKVIRDKLVERIKEVEKVLTCNVTFHSSPNIVLPVPQAQTLKQQPSTLALMAKHGDIPASSVPPPQAMAPQMPIQELSPLESAAREATMNLLKRKHRPLEVKA